MPAVCETTLLIHPWVLTDFTEYNDFLEVCEAAVSISASKVSCKSRVFTPSTGSPARNPQDIENYTNRSPYPMLHILREASIERALAECRTRTKSTGAISARCGSWATRVGRNCGAISASLCASG